MRAQSCFCLFGRLEQPKQTSRPVLEHRGTSSPLSTQIAKRAACSPSLKARRSAAVIGERIALLLVRKSQLPGPTRRRGAASENSCSASASTIRSPVAVSWIRLRRSSSVRLAASLSGLICRVSATTAEEISSVISLASRPSFAFTPLMAARYEATRAAGLSSLDRMARARQVVELPVGHGGDTRRQVRVCLQSKLKLLGRQDTDAALHRRACGGDVRAEMRKSNYVARGTRTR